MPGNTDHNLWRGSEYVRGKGVLLCLRNTYAASTHDCAQNFRDRVPDWFDYSFGIMVGWIIGRKGQTREQAMAPIAITNFVERQFTIDGRCPTSMIA